MIGIQPVARADLCRFNVRLVWSMHSGLVHPVPTVLCLLVDYGNKLCYDVTLCCYVMLLCYVVMLCCCNFVHHDWSCLPGYLVSPIATSLAVLV